jgi:hypothetical protein
MNVQIIPQQLTAKQLEQIRQDQLRNRAEDWVFDREVREAALTRCDLLLAHIEWLNEVLSIGRKYITDEQRMHAFERTAREVEQERLRRESEAKAAAVNEQFVG